MRVLASEFKISFEFVWVSVNFLQFQYLRQQFQAHGIIFFTFNYFYMFSFNVNLRSKKITFLTISAEKGIVN